MARKTVEEETKTTISTTSSSSEEIPSAAILTNLITPDDIPLDLTGTIKYKMLLFTISLRLSQILDIETYGPILKNILNEIQTLQATIKIDTLTLKPELIDKISAAITPKVMDEMKDAIVAVVSSKLAGILMDQLKPLCTELRKIKQLNISLNANVERMLIALERLEFRRHINLN